MAGYLKVDMTRLTFAEAWRWGGLRNIWLLALWKLLGSSRYGPASLPDSDGIIRLDPPEEQRQLIESAVQEVEAGGFERLFYYTVDSRGAAPSLGLAALHRSGRAIAMVIRAGSDPYRETVTALLSRRVDGRIVGTSNAKLVLEPPPEVESMGLAGRPVAEVIGRHMERLEGSQIEPIARGDVESAIVQAQRIIREHNLRRGLYVRA